jgi:hypothetical protein
MLRTYLIAPEKLSFCENINFDDSQRCWLAYVHTETKTVLPHLVYISLTFLHFTGQILLKLAGVYIMVKIELNFFVLFLK